jgi:protein TonB
MNKAKRERWAAVGSVLAHLIVLAVLVLGPFGTWFAEKIQTASDTAIAFHSSSGESSPSGSSGKAEQPPLEEPVPRAPIPPRPLNLDELEAPDLPTEPTFDDAFASDTVDIPRIAGSVVGGVATGVDASSRSSSTRTGLMPTPGSWDSDPVPIYEPPSPPYPATARERMVQGEVILQVLVKLDGSTEVVRVIKSLPFCVEAAKENARHWRWKPALKNGKPVEALGIITVEFDIFSQDGKKT